MAIMGSTYLAVTGSVWQLRDVKVDRSGRKQDGRLRYRTCGSCHLAHAARFALAPRLLQR